MTDLADVIRIYEGSNGEATKALYRELEQLGPAGVVATNLFRACKASERAKQYRGGGYRGMAYDKKQWSMGLLCAVLSAESERLCVRWGWSVDQKLKAAGDPHFHVLYVDLPTGQVSFHSGDRCQGGDYPGEWDGVRGVSVDRICRWIGRLLQAEPTEPAA